MIYLAIFYPLPEYFTCCFLYQSTCCLLIDVPEYVEGESVEVAVCIEIQRTLLRRIDDVKQYFTLLYTWRRNGARYSRHMAQGMLC